MNETRSQTEQLLNLNLDLMSRSVVEGFITGLHKSPFHGFSVEFAEHRLYNTGESVKSIDWKLFARTDKLFIKRFEEETNLRCQLVVDTSSSMYFPERKLNKISFSVYAAAALIYLLKKQKDAFGLSTFDEEIQFNSSCRSTLAHQKIVFQELEKLLLSAPRTKKTSLAKTLHFLSDSLHQRSMVIIFSDLFESMHYQSDLLAAIRHLRFNKHEVIIFQVLDREKELDFNFENRPWLFTDLETGTEYKINPNTVKAEYQLRMQAFKDELILKCGQNHCDFNSINISDGFYNVLNAFLLRRNKML